MIRYQWLKWVHNATWNDAQDEERAPREARSRAHTPSGELKFATFYNNWNSSKDIGAWCPNMPDAFQILNGFISADHFRFVEDFCCIFFMASKLSDLTKQGANERGARKATKRGRRLKGLSKGGELYENKPPWGMHPRSHICYFGNHWDCWIVAFQANRLEKERQRQRRVAVEAGEASEGSARSAGPGGQTCELHGDSQLKCSMN